MSAVIAPQVAREILALVDASDHTDRTLDRIAGDHGLTLAELRTLIARRGTPLVRRVSRPADEEPEPTPKSKACSKCKKVQPLSEFHSHSQTRDGKSSQCRKCNSKRPPTVNRLVRTRARGRAMYLLVENHRAEFEQLLEEQTVIAQAEHDKVAAAAAEKGLPDAPVARLMSGPKRREQTDILERLDVARCPTCHTHHDADHVCPSCGTETGTTPGQDVAS